MQITLHTWSFPFRVCHEPFFLLAGILKSGHARDEIQIYFTPMIGTCLFICMGFSFGMIYNGSVQKDRSHKSYHSVMKTHYESQSHLRVIRVRFTGEANTWQAIPLLWATAPRRALWSVKECEKESTVLSLLTPCVRKCVCFPQPASPVYLMCPDLSDPLQRALLF